MFDDGSKRLLHLRWLVKELGTSQKEIGNLFLVDVVLGRHFTHLVHGLLLVPDLGVHPIPEVGDIRDLLLAVSRPSAVGFLNRRTVRGVALRGLSAESLTQGVHAIRCPLVVQFGQIRFGAHVHVRRVVQAADWNADVETAT